MTLAALFLALIATPADVASTSTPNAGRGEPVLLDFHTEWCGPCKAMRPGIAQLIRAGYPVRSIDGDRDRENVRRYGVTAYPTFVIVDEEGAVLARTEGYQPAADLANLYKQAQTKLLRAETTNRPRAKPVSERHEDADENPRARPAEDVQDADEDPPAPKRASNPNPWETVVRIRMKLGNGYEGVGSGTIIYSNARESIILTCAHIFKEEGRRTPPPSQYKTPISVDLFDGQLGGPKKNQVHHTETLSGQAIDYDPANDVGLIRIRPGRVLAASRVVPSFWQPRAGMNMITVGCSEGREATAWNTHIIRPKLTMSNQGTGESFFAMECEHAPMQGRSGGGIYTSDGYVAGVCDFADPSHGRGLYAVPQAIYRILDRNQLTALYDPKTREPGSEALLAKAGSKPKRASDAGVYRGQSPVEDEPSMPRPEMFGIKPPVVTAENPAPRKSATGRPWQVSTASPTPSQLATRRRPPAEPATEAVPAEMSRQASDDLPAPPASDEVSNPEDLPARSAAGTPTKWRPVRKD
jgi:thiol-disulfide isomerase/thioredoxin